jgi:hypothetical protein
MLGKIFVAIRTSLSSEPCPTEQQLVEYVEQQAIGSERHLVERHLAHCDLCLRQVGFLVRGIQEPTKPVPEEAIQKARALGTGRPRKPPFPWDWTTVTVGGLAAVLVIFMGWTLPRAPHTISPDAAVGRQAPAISRSSPAIPDATAQRDATRGEQVALDAPILSPRSGEKVTANDLQFRWRPIKRASFYELQVLSENGDVVWETRCNSTSTKLPAQVHLLPGETYYVRLKVHINGGTIEASKPVRFVAG